MAATPSATPFRGIGSLAVLVFSLIFVYDALHYHGMLSSASRSIGPSKNWLAKPYTNLRAYGEPQPRTRPGSDWGFQDVTFSKKQFRNTLREADKKVDAVLDRHIKP